MLASALAVAQLFLMMFVPVSDSMQIYGLMVTQSDYWVMHTWLAVHAWQFEKLVILDGTTNVEHASRIEAAASLFDNVIYANEQQLSPPPPKTDNGLRGVAWSLLPNQSQALGSWIVVAHPDEFYLQRFSDLASRAEAEDANLITMKVLYALPYVKDQLHLEKGVKAAYQNFNILHRVRYCVSDYLFLENRMYKYDSENIRWGTRHGYTLPEDFPNLRKANWSGWYVHYKLHNFDDNSLSSDGKLVHSSWSNIGSSSDLYSNLDEKHAKLCAAMANELCSPGGLDPPCTMPIL